MAVGSNLSLASLKALPIHVINRRSQPSRWEATRASLAAVGLSPLRFDAVDGADPQQLASAEAELATFMRAPLLEGYSQGQQGCALSHLLLMHRFLLTSQAEYLHVAEDDARPRADFWQRLACAWPTLPEAWGLLQLGNDYPRPASTPCAAVLQGAFGAHHYVIRRAAIEKLLRLV